MRQRERRQVNDNTHISKARISEWMQANAVAVNRCQHILSDLRVSGIPDFTMLFGSTARDAARDNSDVDILVAFDGPATSERYFGVQFYLEDLLGLPVDLVTEKALRSELRPYIEKEAVHV